MHVCTQPAPCVCMQTGAEQAVAWLFQGVPLLGMQLPSPGSSGKPGRMRGGRAQADRRDSNGSRREDRVRATEVPLHASTNTPQGSQQPP